MISRKTCVVFSIIALVMFVTPAAVFAGDQNSASSSRFAAMKTVMQKRFAVLKERVSSTVKDPAKAQKIIALKKEGKERFDALEKEYKARTEALQMKYFSDLRVVQQELETKRAALRQEMKVEQEVVVKTSSSASSSNR